MTDNRRLSRESGEQRPEGRIGKPGNQGNSMQASRITGNQDTLQMVRGFAAYPHTKCFHTRTYTVLHRFLGLIALIGVHGVRYVQATSHRLNLWNSRLMICSTIVESALQIGAVFFKTKPIFRRGKIQVISVLTKDYEEKARLVGESKQSQTKPISGKANVKMGSFSGLNELGPPMCSAGFDGRRASVYNHAAGKQHAEHTGQAVRKGHGLIQEG